MDDAYSSGAQRRADDRGQLFDAYVGQLRFDALFSECIVIPDTHVLDGTFFSRCPPADLAARVGRGYQARTLPLEVRARRTDARAPRLLEGALRALLFRADRPYLSAFPFNSLRDAAARVRLAETLGQTPAVALTDRIASATSAQLPSRMAAFLRDLLADSASDADFDAMEGGWHAWLEAERQGLVRVEPWDAHFDLRAALVERRLDPEADLETPAIREAYAHVLRVALGSSFRADVTPVFEQFRANFGWRTAAEQDPADDEAVDLATVDRWYTSSRHLAIARQHHSDLAYTLLPYARPVTTAERIVAKFGSEEPVDADLVFFNDLFPQLTVMEGEAFGRFTNLHADRLRRIWLTGRIDEAKRLIDDLHAAVADAAARRTTSTAALASFAMVAAPLGVAAAAWGAPPATAATAGLVAGAASAAREQVQVAGRRRLVRRRIIEYLHRRRYESADG